MPLSTLAKSHFQHAADAAAIQDEEDVDVHASVSKLLPSRVSFLDIRRVIVLHGLPVPTMVGEPGGPTRRVAINEMRAYVGLPLLGDHDPPSLPVPVLVGPLPHEVPVYQAPGHSLLPPVMSDVVSLPCVMEFVRHYGVLSQPSAARAPETVAAGGAYEVIRGRPVSDCAWVWDC